MNSSETAQKRISPFAFPPSKTHPPGSGGMVRTSVLADCVTRLIHGRVHEGSKDKQRQAKPAACKHSAIQPVTQPRTRRHCHLCVYEQTCAREHSALASGEHSALASGEHSALASGEMHSVRSTHAA